VCKHLKSNAICGWLKQADDWQGFAGQDQPYRTPPLRHAVEKAKQVSFVDFNKALLMVRDAFFFFPSFF